ncbi:uncharacterized protein TRAVEDRAFT_51194 [Trametes versicolor FP-101664 SS1]|uniref:uncharacterized protein n=1 Tax=Trametes versicolor (strain FP-101664) TaxID=717944 RepID=UPI0004624192|nr:uncharacterized protein TRAVEDRAFT_51194 [Trametes versicolor FP-101664 SS1]EIW55065.1 hypothetical protein TRAVEDRAFT_51194 [Trametes versicolor FP-101664 SS1]
MPKRRDPNVLRRPPNAFMLYRTDKQKLMQEEGRGNSQVNFSKEIGSMWTNEDARVKAEYQARHDELMARYRVKLKEQQAAQKAVQTAAAHEEQSSGSSSAQTSSGPNTPSSASGQPSDAPFQRAKDDKGPLTPELYKILVREEQQRVAYMAERMFHLSSQAHAAQNTMGFTMQHPPPQQSPVRQQPGRAAAMYPPGHPYARAPAPAPQPQPQPQPQPEPLVQQYGKIHQAAPLPEDSAYAAFQAQMKEYWGESFQGPLLEEEDKSLAVPDEQPGEPGLKSGEPRTVPKSVPVKQSVGASGKQVEQLGGRAPATSRPGSSRPTPSQSAPPRLNAAQPNAPLSAPGKLHRSPRHNVAHAPPVQPMQRRMPIPQPQLTRLQMPVPQPQPMQWHIPAPRHQHQHSQPPMQPPRWNTELGQLNSGYIDFTKLPPMRDEHGNIKLPPSKLLLDHAYRRQFGPGFVFPANGPPVPIPMPMHMHTRRAQQWLAGGRPPAPAPVPVMTAAIPAPGWNRMPAPSRGMQAPPVPFNRGVKRKFEDTRDAAPSSAAPASRSFQPGSTLENSRRSAATALLDDAPYAIDSGSWAVSLRSPSSLQGPAQQSAPAPANAGQASSSGGQRVGEGERPPLGSAARPIPVVDAPSTLGYDPLEALREDAVWPEDLSTNEAREALLDSWFEFSPKA